MGMFSEITASINAASLKKAILEARDKFDNESVKLYVKIAIYPIYKDAVFEACENQDKEVVDFIRSIKND